MIPTRSYYSQGRIIYAYRRIAQAAFVGHHLDTYVRRFMHATPFTAHSQRYYYNEVPGQCPVRRTTSL